MSAAPSISSDGNPVALHIARVAARLFATQGYDATSVREIVAGAGVTKPTLYYYFGSKEGLARALVTVPLANLVGVMRRTVEGEADPVRCLEQILEAHFAFCREDPDRMRFLYALFFGPPSSGLAIFQECCDKQDIDRWLEAAVQRLVDAGVIRANRKDACITMFRGVTVISTVDFLYEGKPLGDGLARGLVSDLLAGFDMRRGGQDLE